MHEGINDPSPTHPHTHIPTHPYSHTISHPFAASGIPAPSAAAGSLITLAPTP